MTLTRWEDIWLNEGFATYAEDLWLDELSPGFIDGYMPQAYAQFAEPRPEMGIPGNPSVEGLFGPASYYGAAVVLHALRIEVGDDAFFELLRTWATRYRGKNATTNDFIDLASEISGKDQRAFLEGWLYSPIAPPYPKSAEP